MTNMRQLFQQLPQAANSPEAEDDARWNYFQEHILMPMLRTGQTRTLIVAPSYVHYVRIRNELLRLEANAAFVCEYSRDSEISRGRSRFYHGRHDILLYSGRCHFFRRYRIRGAQHVVFYGLPEYETHYPEVLNLLSSESDLKQAGVQRQASLAVQSHSFDKTAGSEGSGNKSCTALVLFSALDVLALNRIVGSKRAKHMLKSDKATFMFQ
jgi:U3 small nucleolar RNA-associated protein 25